MMFGRRRASCMHGALLIMRAGGWWCAAPGSEFSCEPMRRIGRIKRGCWYAFDGPGKARSAASASPPPIRIDPPNPRSAKTRIVANAPLIGCRRTKTLTRHAKRRQAADLALFLRAHPALIGPCLEISDYSLILLECQNRRNGPEEPTPGLTSWPRPRSNSAPSVACRPLGWLMSLAEQG